MPRLKRPDQTTAAAASHFEATHIFANPDREQAQELMSELPPEAMNHFDTARS
jgi:hypothetical protein